MAMNFHFLKLFASLFILSCVGARVSSPEGTFYGVLPCADCQGIEYELTLNADGTYAKRTHYLGRGMQVHNATGTYEILGRNRLVLGGKDLDNGMNQFAIMGSELEMLDTEGEEIETGFRELYILSKERPVNFMAEKPVRYDVKFRGHGNEPFWSLEMDFDHHMTLRTLDSHELDLRLVTDGSTPPVDGNEIRYQGAADGTKVRVTIVRRACHDTMADTSYSHEVRVRVSKDGAEDFAEYEGCGDFRGEAGLNDIWALVSINGDELEDKKSVPSVEIQVSERKVFGFSGCNRMSGSVEFFDDSIKFGTLATTRRACMEPNVEAQFLKIITDREMKYEIVGLQLILKADGDTLVFKKVD